MEPCSLLMSHIGGEEKKKRRGMGQVTIRDLWAKTQKGLVKIQTSVGPNVS